MNAMQRVPRIFWFATKGTESNDALRIDTLLSEFETRKEIQFSKKLKLVGLFNVMRTIRAEKPDLLVMEATGIAGGLSCLYGRLLCGVPYVVSSGDAVGPFMRAHHRLAGWAFEIYERVLCARSAGFIGWTPYLCGRAMTFGCPRAVTAAGWALGGDASMVNVPEARERTRAKFGIPPDDIVVGIVGALEWNPKKQYCYGWDLVECARRVKRQDLKFVIIGGGSGLDRLRAIAGDRLGKQIFLPGPVPLEEVVPSMCAFDIASLPQSMDGVGMFRYTTKIAEYLTARLPVITNQVPMAYDLGAEWMWRLPGNAPWDVVFLDALGRFLEGLQRSEIAETKARIPKDLAGFRMDEQIRRVTLFVNDLIASPQLRASS